MKQSEEAAIVVDYQNGFIPEAEKGTGELGVEGGGLLAPRINQIMKEIKTKGGLIIATRDMHPQGHISFASNYTGKDPFDTLNYDEVANDKTGKLQLSDQAEFTREDLEIELGATGSQVLWPNHCVEGTDSAQYHEDLDRELIDHHIIKGYDPTTEMYSGFFGREDTPEGKSLRDILREAGVESVRIIGLATDYCVRSTAVDAVKNGFRTLIDSSAIAGVSVKSPEDTIEYLRKLREEHDVNFS